jgi:hypothetical protein
VNEYEADPWLTRTPGLHKLFDCVASPSFAFGAEAFDECLDRLLASQADEDFVQELVTSVDAMMECVCQFGKILQSHFSVSGARRPPAL